MDDKKRIFSEVLGTGTKEEIIDFVKGILTTFIDPDMMIKAMGMMDKDTLVKFLKENSTLFSMVKSFSPTELPESWKPGF